MTKNFFLEGKATKAQEAAVAGDSRSLYKITRELTGSYKTQTMPTVVRDKEGKDIT